MEYKDIYTSNKNKVLTITINRPNKLNALNKNTILELADIFNIVEADNEVRAIIITGEGEKAFIAGADISEFSNFNSTQGRDLSSKGHNILFNVIENLNKPVIAAINGFALGGGLELAMSAHIRVASDNAKMGLPETSLGLIPGYGGTQRLTQLIGKGRAMEMILSAKMTTAEDAYKYGLINHIVSQNDLIPFCEEIAMGIIKNSSTAISKAIKTINASTKNNIDGFELEIEEFGNCFSTKDFKEGTSAFLEKRVPKF